MALTLPPHPSPARVPTLRSRQGFALLITVTLLAFLVLLLVSLASLTRVETQVAGNNQNLAQARQNALLALNIALGQLQKFTGPDHRVTGTADLAGGAGGIRLDNAGAPANTASINAVSNGLGTVQPGTRYWTGVWGNSELSAATVGNGNSYEKTPSPVLLNWLVSGNEQTTFTQPDLTIGQITAANGGGSTVAPLFNPGIAPVLPTSATTTGTVKDRTNATADTVLLMGTATAGDSTTDRTLPDGSTEKYYDRYVVAPLVNITAPAGSVPGLAAAATPTVGRYAYWVGDEGVKARLNLVDPYAADTNATTDDKARYRLLTAPRSGLEAVTDFTASSYQSWSQATATTPPLAQLLSLKQAGLLDAFTLTPSVLGKHVHDLTSHTLGIEADTLNGGLRRDLTFYFSQATLPAWAATNRVAAGAGNSIIPTAYSPYYNGTSYVPRWDVLRDFYNLYNSKQVSGAVPAQAATLTQMGVTPELLQVRIIIGVNATNGQMMKGLFTPLIALGNPYSTPINLTGLKVQFWLADTFAGETWPNPVERMSSIGADPSPTFNTGRFMKVFTYEGDTSNSYGALTGAVTFTLPTVTLQPGEAKLFSLNGNYDAAGASIPLVAGEAADFATTYHYVYRTSTRLSPATGSGGQNYKFTEGDVMTPVVVKFLDSSNQTVLKIEGLNVDASTNSYGLYWEPNGATNTDRVIVAYNFDLGDPGVSSSIADPALRLYTDFNPRGAVTRRTNATLLSGAYFRYSPNTGDLATANTLTPSVPPTTFTSNLDPVEWGYHGQSLSPVLYDLPQGAMPVLSMGQLQQANLTADDIALNVGHQPALAVGNSYASPFLTRNLTVQGRTDTYNTRYNNGSQPAYNATRNYYDISYLLNTTLWDGSFFSTIPQSGTAYDPVSPRLTLTASTTAAQARNGQQAAAHTLIKGAFNINSTSVDAWTALLAGMRGLPALPVTGATTSTKTTVFPRTLRQPADSLTPGGATAAVAPSGDKADSYSGFRRLTDAQITTLATAIVKQVRLRGPFVSLGHFVNRALITAAADTNRLGFAGALQTAIDSTTINDFTDVTTMADKLVIPDNHTYYADAPTATNFATNAGRLQRSTGIPGWLTQADVLQAVGSVLAARSDTFVIRTYGDVKNPVTGDITGRAWCEAVVQRLPDYMDSGANTAWTAPISVSTTNQTFGRRFIIVSFRWLGPDDI